ncbi:MAG: glycosyltransferase, partial [Gemmatimonadota bacterium]
IEAMASGTPIVASDLPAFREVAGDHALYVRPHDHVAWAESAIRLLHDAPRRDAVGRAGRVAALEYAWPRVIERVVAVYERVIAEARGRGRRRRGGSGSYRAVPS